MIPPSTFSGLFIADLWGGTLQNLAHRGMNTPQPAATICSAISSILVTLFQLRPVPEVPSARSMAAIKRRAAKERQSGYGIPEPQAKIVRDVVIPETITVGELEIGRAHV